MKKLVALIVVAITIALAGSAMAFDVGGAVKDAGKKAAKSGAAASINKDLDKYSCSWDGKAITTCYKNKKEVPFNSIAAALSAGRATAESQGGTDFEVNVHAPNYQAYNAAKNKLKSAGVGGWDINNRTDSSLGNTLKFSVDIQ